MCVFYFICSVDTITDVPASPLPLPASPAFLWPSPPCCLCLCLCVMQTYSLSHPLAFFHSVTPFPARPRQLSVCSTCPCLYFYFVHQFVLLFEFHINETRRYLFFFGWLISLSILISTSISAVSKGNIPFIFMVVCVVFHCVNVPQPFYPLIYWWALGLFADLGYCQ